MVTFSLGWWLLPLAITIGMLTWSAKLTHEVGDDPIGGGIVLLSTGAVATIVSLSSWLIWALVN